MTDRVNAARQRLALEKNLLKCLRIGWRNRRRRADGYVERNDDIVVDGTRCPHPIPRRIWMYWDTPEVPTLVRAAVARIRSLNPDHAVTLLNQRTVRDVVDTDILERADMLPAHKSDIIRLELLDRHGGIWIDATCIAQEDFAWVHRARAQHGSDIIGFFRENATTDRANPILENWFLCGEPGNRFNAEWLAELRHIHAIGIGAYHAGLREDPAYPDLCQKIKRPDYLVAYVASQVVTRRIGDLGMSLRRAESSAYHYQDAADWNREQVAATLCRQQAPVVPMPIIKLTSSNRYLIPTLLRRGLVRRDSIVGDFIASTL